MAPRFLGIAAVLFDKDGTLFDFQRSWGGWAHGMIGELAGSDAGLAAALADAMDFDMGTQRFRPQSQVIAGTGAEVTALLAPLVLEDATDPQQFAALEARLARRAGAMMPVEAAPLTPLLARLRGAGLRLGIATNDNESSARRHVMPWAEAFDQVIGYDSGHGAKPEPGMCLAFARAAGLDPASVLMVGDSRHDLAAGRAAGMPVLAVLSGVAGRAELAPYADEVAESIEALPGLLGL